MSLRGLLKWESRHFLRDVLYNEVSIGQEPYWHRPIVITGMSARLGDVIGLMKMKPEHPEDDVHRPRFDPGVGKAKAHHLRRRSFGTALAGNHDTGSQPDLKDDDAEQYGRYAFDA